jgi:hypothetical protein
VVTVIATRRRRNMPADSSNAILIVSAIVPLLVIAGFGVASLIF